MSSDIYINVTVKAGTTIEDAARQAVRMADKFDNGVSFTFNGIELKVNITDTVAAVVNKYNTIRKAQ